MISYLEKRQKTLPYRILSAFIAFTFTFGLALPPSYAQSVFTLPAPGTMVTTSPGFTPTLINGIIIHPENPLKFDFIIGSGDQRLEGQAFEDESTRLIKYFLASLTVPETEMWVNLSPYEKDRIIPNGFGTTEMGRDLLAQDYILKQLTASLMYPEKELGSAFWKKIYQKAYEQYGTTEIPVNTFNKVWIVPEKAVVYEHENSAFVVKSHLKVMLESDYEAQRLDTRSSMLDTRNQSSNEHPASSIETSIIKEVILPELEKEVNEGQTFANLRQIYNSVILAAWFKKNLKETLLGQVYVDKGKTKGVDLEDKTVNQKIYEQYLEAFKKGVYNYIKEDYDPATKEIIPRKYFSGGTSLVVGPVLEESQRIDGYIARQMGWAQEQGRRVEVDMLELSENTSVAAAQEAIASAKAPASSPMKDQAQGDKPRRSLASKLTGFGDGIKMAGIFAGLLCGAGGCGTLTNIGVSVVAPTAIAIMKTKDTDFEVYQKQEFEKRVDEIKAHSNEIFYIYDTGILQEMAALEKMPPKEAAESIDNIIWESFSKGYLVYNRPLVKKMRQLMRERLLAELAAVSPFVKLLWQEGVISVPNHTRISHSGYFLGDVIKHPSAQWNDKDIPELEGLFDNPYYGEAARKAVERIQKGNYKVTAQEDGAQSDGIYVLRAIDEEELNLLFLHVVHEQGSVPKEAKSPASSPIGVFAQRVTTVQGAETSAVYIQNAIRQGANGILAGHSESRGNLQRESNAKINEQLLAAHKFALTGNILAVGETSQELNKDVLSLNIEDQKQKELGELSQLQLMNAQAVVEMQLRLGLKGLTVEQFLGDKIAYEPRWAISGPSFVMNASPKTANLMSEFIKATLAGLEVIDGKLTGRFASKVGAADSLGWERARKVKVLFGGSVDAKSAESYLSLPNVDGLLVGSKSAKVDTFRPILEVAKRVNEKTGKSFYVGGNLKTYATDTYQSLVALAKEMASPSLEIGFGPQLSDIREFAQEISTSSPVLVDGMSPWDAFTAEGLSDDFVSVASRMVRISPAMRGILENNNLGNRAQSIVRDLEGALEANPDIYEMRVLGDDQFSRDWESGSYKVAIMQDDFAVEKKSKIGVGTFLGIYKEEKLVGALFFLNGPITTLAVTDGKKVAHYAYDGEQFSARGRTLNLSKDTGKDSPVSIGGIYSEWSNLLQNYYHANGNEIPGSKSEVLKTRYSGVLGEDGLMHGATGTNLYEILVNNGLFSEIVRLEEAKILSLFAESVGGKAFVMTADGPKSPRDIPGDMPAVQVFLGNSGAVGKMWDYFEANKADYVPKNIAPRIPATLKQDSDKITHSQTTLEDFLETRVPRRLEDREDVIDALKIAAKVSKEVGPLYLGGAHPTGVIDSGGAKELTIDKKTDRLFSSVYAGKVGAYYSEDRGLLTDFHGKPGSRLQITADALDGSSRVEANGGAASIISVRNRLFTDSIEEHSGREIIASVLVVHGITPTIIMAIEGMGAHEFVIDQGTFYHSRAIDLSGPKDDRKGLRIALGGSRAEWPKDFPGLVDQWVEGDTMPGYSGAAGTDVYGAIDHILDGGRAIFAQPREKLRVKSEIQPLAHLIQVAGGDDLTWRHKKMGQAEGLKRSLDVNLTIELSDGKQQLGPASFGSPEVIEEVKAVLAASSPVKIEGDWNERGSIDNWAKALSPDERVRHVAHNLDVLSWQHTYFYWNQEQLQKDSVFEVETVLDRNGALIWFQNNQHRYAVTQDQSRSKLVIKNEYNQEMNNLQPRPAYTLLAGAAERLGALRDQSVVPMLLEKLQAIFDVENNYSAHNARQKIIMALGQLRDERAVMPLVELLFREQSAQQRWFITWALGDIGDNRAVAPLLNVRDKFKVTHEEPFFYEALSQFADREALEVSIAYFKRRLEALNKEVDSSKKEFDSAWQNFRVPRENYAAGLKEALVPVADQRDSTWKALGEAEGRLARLASSPVKTILLVDDDLNVLSNLGASLTLHGFKVISVESGEAAEEVIKSQKVDAVLADHLMGQGKMTGSQLADKVSGKLPVFLMVFSPDPQALPAIAALNGRIAGAFTKPNEGDPEALDRMLQGLDAVFPQVAATASSPVDVERFPRFASVELDRVQAGDVIKDSVALLAVTLGRQNYYSPEELRYTLNLFEDTVARLSESKYRDDPDIFTRAQEIRSRQEPYMPGHQKNVESFLSVLSLSAQQKNIKINELVSIRKLFADLVNAYLRAESGRIATAVGDYAPGAASSPVKNQVAESTTLEESKEYFVNIVSNLPAQAGYSEAEKSRIITEIRKISNMEELRQWMFDNMNHEVPVPDNGKPRVSSPIQEAKADTPAKDMARVLEMIKTASTTKLFLTEGETTHKDLELAGTLKYTQRSGDGYSVEFAGATLVDKYGYLSNQTVHLISGKPSIYFSVGLLRADTIYLGIYGTTDVLRMRERTGRGKEGPVFVLSSMSQKDLEAEIAASSPVISEQITGPSGTSLELSIPREYAWVLDHVKESRNDMRKGLGALRSRPGNFVGWKDWPVNMLYELESQKMFEVSQSLRLKIQAGDVENIVLIGIGGSTAPIEAELDLLYGNAWRTGKIGLENSRGVRVFIADTTAEEKISRILDQVNLAKTAVVVNSKSGETLEPDVAFRLFKQKLIDAQGERYAQYVYVVTDKARGVLRQEAEKNGYQIAGIVPDNVGGRFSIFTAVGMFVLDVLGQDIAQVRNGAQSVEDDEQAKLLGDVAAIPATIGGLMAQMNNAVGSDVIVWAYASDRWRGEKTFFEQINDESIQEEGKGPAVFEILANGQTRAVEALLLGRKDMHVHLVVDEWMQSDPRLREEFEQRVARLKERGLPQAVVRIPKMNAYYLGLYMQMVHNIVADAGVLLLNDPELAFLQAGVEQMKKYVKVLLGDQEKPEIKQELVELLGGKRFAFGDFQGTTTEQIFRNLGLEGIVPQKYYSDGKVSLDLTNLLKTGLTEAQIVGEAELLKEDVERYIRDGKASAEFQNSYQKLSPADRQKAVLVAAVLRSAGKKNSNYWVYGHFLTEKLNKAQFVDFAAGQGSPSLVRVTESPQGQHSVQNGVLLGENKWLNPIIVIDNHGNSLSVPEVKEDYLKGQTFDYILNSEAMATALAMTKYGRPNFTIMIKDLADEDYLVDFLKLSAAVSGLATASSPLTQGQKDYLSIAYAGLSALSLSKVMEVYGRFASGEINVRSAGKELFDLNDSRQLGSFYLSLAAEDEIRIDLAVFKAMTKFGMLAERGKASKLKALLQTPQSEWARTEAEKALGEKARDIIISASAELAAARATASSPVLTPSQYASRIADALRVSPDSVMAPVNALLSENSEKIQNDIREFIAGTGVDEEKLAKIVGKGIKEFGGQGIDLELPQQIESLLAVSHVRSEFISADGIIQQIKVAMFRIIDSEKGHQAIAAALVSRFQLKEQDVLRALSNVKFSSLASSPVAKLFIVPSEEGIFTRDDGAMIHVDKKYWQRVITKIKQILGDSDVIEELARHFAISASELESIAPRLVKVEDEAGGTVLKLDFYSTRESFGKKTLNLKLRHSDRSKNPTDLEHEYTFKASQKGIHPKAIIVGDTLVYEDVPGGISLKALLETENDELVWSFLSDDKGRYILRELGRSLGKLNKTVGVTKYAFSYDDIVFDIRRGHVYIMNLVATDPYGAKLATPYGAYYDRNADLETGKSFAKLMADPSSAIGKVLAKDKSQGWMEMQGLYAKWVEEGYGSIPASSPVAYWESDLETLSSERELRELEVGIGAEIGQALRDKVSAKIKSLMSGNVRWIMANAAGTLIAAVTDSNFVYLYDPRKDSLVVEVDYRNARGVSPQGINFATKNDGKKILIIDQRTGHSGAMKYLELERFASSPVTRDQVEARALKIIGDVLHFSDDQEIMTMDLEHDDEVETGDFINILNGLEAAFKVPLSGMTNFEFLAVVDYIYEKLNNNNSASSPVAAVDSASDIAEIRAQIRAVLATEKFDKKKAVDLIVHPLHGAQADLEGIRKTLAEGEALFSGVNAQTLREAEGILKQLVVNTNGWEALRANLLVRSDGDIKLVLTTADQMIASSPVDDGYLPGGTIRFGLLVIKAILLVSLIHLIVDAPTHNQNVKTVQDKIGDWPGKRAEDVADLLKQINNISNTFGAGDFFRDRTVSTKTTKLIDAVIEHKKQNVVAVKDIVDILDNSLSYGGSLDLLTSMIEDKADFSMQDLSSVKAIAGVASGENMGLMQKLYGQIQKGKWTTARDPFLPEMERVVTTVTLQDKLKEVLNELIVQAQERENPGTLRYEIDVIVNRLGATSASSPVTESRQSSDVSRQLKTDDGRLMTSPGGIDLNPALLDLQIKRDGNGVPLPLPLQPIKDMHIEGFLPVIINVTPITNLPLLLGISDTDLPSNTADSGAQPLELGFAVKEN